MEKIFVICIVDKGLLFRLLQRLRENVEIDKQKILIGTNKSQNSICK